MIILRILMKDLKVTAATTGALLLIFIGLAVLAQFISATVIMVCAIVFSGVYLISTLLITERYEDKNNGYFYLLTLPVLPFELVSGKLILLYLMNIFACGLVILIVRIFGPDPRSILIFQSVALMAGCIWLITLTILYSGICMLGFTKFIVAFRIGILSLLVAIQAAGVLAFRASDNLPGTIGRIGDGIASAPWVWVCLLVSLAYFAYFFAGGRLVRLHAAR